MAYVIGVDVGGTFTDAVLDDDAGTVLAAKSPSTPPDYSRGVLDVLELLAEQLGSSLPDMLAHTHRPPPHRPRPHVGAERAGHGPRPAGRVPDHQGPPRLHLHHERRGPVPRPVPARAAERSRPGQGPRAAAQAARPGGHRARR